MHAEGRANTSRTASCCSWSTSPSSTNESTLAESVDAEADVLQDARVVPRDELRADDAGVRSIQLLDQQADRAGIEGDVVVQEAEEAVVALDQAQHLVGG